MNLSLSLRNNSMERNQSYEKYTWMDCFELQQTTTSDGNSSQQKETRREDAQHPECLCNVIIEKYQLLKWNFKFPLDMNI